MKTLGRALIVVVSLLGGTLVHAGGDAEAGKAKAMVCGGCHGMDGNSGVADFPKLAGQNERYLAKQIRDIKGDADGVRRAVPVMAAMVAALSEQDINDIAAFYAAQVSTPGVAKADLVELGERIYRAGNRETGVAACTACHAPRGTGNAPAGFPRLSGQHPQYLAKQLQDFRNGTRNNDGDGRMMRDVARFLSDEEIRAVASYAAGLY